VATKFSPVPCQGQQARPELVGQENAREGPGSVGAGAPPDGSGNDGDDHHSLERARHPQSPGFIDRMCR